MRGLHEFFVQGLTRASVVSVVTALLAILFTMGSCLFLTQPSVLARGGMSYLATTDYDYDAFVTAKVFALSETTDRRPLVAIVGASVTRASFGTEAQIAEAIGAATGADVDVQVLCTARQSLLEALAIIDRLTADRETIFVLGVAPGRFSWNKEALARIYKEPRLGFRAGAGDAVASTLGVQPFESAGFDFIDNRGFFLPRMKYVLINGLFRGRVSIAELRFTNRKLSERQFNVHSSRVMRRYEGYEENFALNSSILASIADIVAAHPQDHLMLVEEAVNPSFAARYLDAPFSERHTQRMRTLSDRLSVRYERFYEDVDVTADEYYDWAHINSPEARERMRKALAAALQPYLLSRDRS